MSKRLYICNNYHRPVDAQNSKMKQRAIHHATLLDKITRIKYNKDISKKDIRMEIGDNLRAIRDRYEMGEIDAKTAWEQALPWVEKYNAKAREIAAKYGMKPKLLATKGAHAHIKFVGR